MKYCLFGQSIAAPKAAIAALLCLMSQATAFRPSFAEGARESARSEFVTWTSSNSKSKAKKFEQSEAVSKAEIEVGPFELLHKYRSMEGPYVIRKFRVADLLASKKVYLPSSTVVYLDKGGAPASMSANLSSTGTGPISDPLAGVVGLKSMPDAERELFWFRGLKLELIDENEKLLPGAEFICHMNLDVDQVTRFSVFPDLEKSGNTRLFTLTQGQTEFYFPKGFAVPVASDEEWKFTFQAANRTTNEHRKIKHLCTLYFSKDSDLKEEPKALHWYNPYIAVQVDGETKAPEHHGPSCLSLSKGENAPNMVPDSPFKDEKGRVLSGHWLVKPGKQTYSIPVSLIEAAMADENRKIHAVWTHVHPACTNTALYECSGEKRKKVFEVNVKTSFANGPELTEIRNLITSKGLELKEKKDYELVAQYDNPQREALDSMVALGVFCASKTFTKPEWTKGSTNVSNENNSKSPMEKANKLREDDSKCNDIYCGIKPPTGKSD